MKLKLKMSMKILTIIKKCLTLINYSTKSKYHDNWNKLVAGKMKDETAGVAVEELKPNMYLYLVDDNMEHKKACFCNNTS